jgi:hypothetical protein
MNINERIGLNWQQVDIATGEKLTHREKYKRIIDVLGYEDVKRCIPFTLDEIRKALKKDENLNNLTLKRWDAAAGFSCPRGECYLIHSQLTNLYRKAGINAFSCSDGVCILKECAKLWAEEDLNNE